MAFLTRSSIVSGDVFVGGLIFWPKTPVVNAMNKTNKAKIVFMVFLCIPPRLCRKYFAKIGKDVATRRGHRPPKYICEAEDLVGRANRFAISPLRSRADFRCRVLVIPR